MATSSLYGSVSESTGLYGIGAASGGTYFEWFIFYDSATAPATPTGGSWDFTTNTGTTPTGWLLAPPASPTNLVWVSIAIVDSRSTSSLVWSTPGLMTGAGLPVLTGSGVPSSGTGLNGQLYINTATTPQSMYNKQSGAWVQLTGSTLYATAGANSNITSLSGITGSISTPDNIQFDTTASAAIAQGNLRWNDTTKTMAFGIVDGTDEVNIGEQMVAYVTNAESTTITRGQAVYLYQAQGNRASVKLAYNTGDPTSAKTLGLVLQDMAPNASGFVMTQGVLDKINTSAFTEGVTLYLGATPGSLTSTKPQAPNHLVYMGVVERANAGNGQIYVRPQNGYELDELHDVRITSVQNGNYLKYDSSVPAWVNVSGPTGTLVGTTDTQTLTNKTISGSSNTLTNIGNASLTNSSLTINGNPVSLGGSTTITAATPHELIFGTGLTSTSNFDGSQETTVTLDAVGTAGVYGSSGTTPQITVNTVGQVTNITPLDIVITTNNISGSVAIAQGGTGASSKKYAMQNLLPDYAGNNGKVLAIDAAGTDLEWRAVTGIGTVTSVDGSGGTTGLTLTGGPITAAGTLTLGGTLGVANGGTGATNNTDARANLGLGSIATQDANNINITGGSITGIIDLAIADGGTGASTAADARTNLGLGTSAVLNAGVAGGVATLDGGGTVPTSQLPAAVLGAVKYQGTWNASTNTPTLASSTGTQGYYYVVSVAGSTNLDGITDWQVGDWAIFNGSIWQKIDNTDQVTSVNGYTGTVNLIYSDVGAPSTTGTNATGTWGISITGNAATANNATTVTNGVYTTGSYADPTWITSLAASKITGTLTNSQLANSSITIGSTTVALGDTSLSLTGVTTFSASADSSFTSTGALTISKGTTAQQPGTPTTGMIRYNSDTNQFEGYSGATPAWKSIGGSALSNDTTTASNLYPVFAGATSGTAENLYTSNANLLYKPSTGELQASTLVSSNGIIVSSATVNTSYSIPAGSNAMSAGPISVASGVTVTVPSGSVWTVI